MMRFDQMNLDQTAHDWTGFDATNCDLIGSGKIPLDVIRYDKICSIITKRNFDLIGSGMTR